MKHILRIALVGSVALFIVAAGCSKASTNSSANDSTTNTTAAATVNITPSGFSPATVTVKVGDTVRFTNNGASKHQPASDPHPTHTDLSEFDANRGLGTDESYSYTFTNPGTFGYHDHLNPSLTGTVIVR